MATEQQIPTVLLGMAKAAADLPMCQRIFSVKGLVHERYRCSETGHLTSEWPKETPCSEREIFEAAFEDPLAPEYWRAWLFELQSLDNVKLADLLATHIADSEARFGVAKSALLEALHRLQPDNARMAVGWLIENPATNDLVPESLRHLLLSSREKEPEKGICPPWAVFSI